DEIVAHQWEKRAYHFLIRWNYGDMTWEPRSNCEELEALDNYLALQGVRSVEELPRTPAPTK
ncbi:hypothetical protein FA95DRAFT_1471280, partial [Auriscalpium vulgare]